MISGIQCNLNGRIPNFISLTQSSLKFCIYCNVPFIETPVTQHLNGMLTSVQNVFIPVKYVSNYIFVGKEIIISQLSALTLKSDEKTPLFWQYNMTNNQIFYFFFHT
jgi:hypothetical protein